jgi:transcriptional regulator with XRE-family HTH domain
MARSSKAVPPSAIGARIREARESLGDEVSDERLARAAKIDLDRYRAIEAGAILPTIAEVDRLATKLQRSVDELSTGPLRAHSPDKRGYARFQITRSQGGRPKAIEDKAIRANVAINARTFREGKGLSQSAASRITGIALAYLNGIEDPDGAKSPTDATLAKLAAVYGRTVDDFKAQPRVVARTMLAGPVHDLLPADRQRLESMMADMERKLNTEALAARERAIEAMKPKRRS